MSKSPGFYHCGRASSSVTPEANRQQQLATMHTFAY